MPLSFMIAHGLRIAGAIQWAVLIYWILRHPRISPQAWTLAAFSFSVMSYSLTPLVLVTECPPWVRILFFAAMFASPVLLWLSAKALFDDEFKVKRSFFWIGGLAILVGQLTYQRGPFAKRLYESLDSAPWIARPMQFIFPQFLTYVFLGLALHVARTGKQADLLESRIRLRKRFIQATSITAFLIASGDIYMKVAGTVVYPLAALTAAMLLVIGYGLNHALARSESDFLGVGSSQVPVSTAAPPQQPGLDSTIAIELNRLIDDERVFLQPSLNVEKLAMLLKVPEYRLRRHINQTLGYRNFNQFLNHHRINEAKRILQSAEGRSAPIYNLAMDLGYGSIVSFNRAFRDSTGQTPTEFRERSDESL